MLLIVPLIIAYILGSISFAIVVSKCMHLSDPRSYGSKNAGATNMLRGGSKLAALITLLGDALKGFIVVFAVKFYCNYLHYSLSLTHIVVALSGILVILGHIYPIFFRFKGGKGVATTLGVIIALSPLVAACLAITWLISFLLSRISGLSAIIAALLLPIYAYFIIGNNKVYLVACILITVLVICKHKSNIVNLYCKDTIPRS